MKNKKLSKPQQYMHSSVVDEEVEKFSQMAGKWWDLEGPLRLLHKINKIRSEYILSMISTHFKSQLDELSIIDVGCGGGILTEQLYHLGCIDITGIDASKDSIAVAKKHAGSLPIKYYHTTVEQLTTSECQTDDSATQKFNVVCVMEVVEHVANPQDFLQQCFSLVQDGGLIILSTINRTIKSLLLAKIAAEYILRWLPLHTHSWQKFLQPSQVIMPLLDQWGQLKNLTGVTYNIQKQTFELSANLAINYMATVVKVTQNMPTNLNEATS